MKKTGKRKKKNSNDSKSPRKYHQFVLETIWAGAAGATVGRWLP